MKIRDFRQDEIMPDADFTNREPLRQHLLWLDLETTGSDEERDCIIEVGCVLTTHDLKPLSEFTSIVKPDPCGLGRLFQNSIVRNMHETNGLLAEILEAGDEFLQHKVTQKLMEWLVAHEVKQNDLVLAGSGVGHFDSKFLRKYMPQLSKYMRYWVIDIGTVRRAHDMWVGGTVSAANEGKTHRSLDDARCHLEEAQAFMALWRKNEDV